MSQHPHQPTNQPTYQPTNGSLDEPTESRRRRRWLAILIVAVLALLGIALRPVVEGVSSALSSAGAGSSATRGAATEEQPDVDDATEDGLDGPDDSAGGGDSQTPQPDPADGDGGGDGGGDEADGVVVIPPVDPPQGPCVGHDPAQGHLRVTPDPLLLASNVKTGEITIRNCGAGDVHWSAAVNPKVSLATASGDLTAGQSSALGFTIDFGAYGNGAIDFKLKVAETGHNHYVDVAAYNPFFGSEGGGPGGFSAGAGVGGCSGQCITKAVLKRNLSSPNVGVQIATNTPAYLSVFVSKNPPVIGPNGPSFGGVAPMDHTDDLRTGWTAQLAPLQPSTQYHVIVRAIDADGDKAFRYGSFTTTSGQVGPGGLADPAGPAGCSLQCITTAKLTQAAGDKAGTEVGLDVVSHTEALFQASVSRNAPTAQAGVPTFADTDAWATSGLQYAKAWQTPLTGLAPATKYYIVVRAEDKQARVSYRSGSFTTATSPTVTASFALVSVHIDQDGDTIGRGEISLGWRVGDTTVATFAERKRDDGDLVTFGTTPWAEQVPMAGFLPTVYVSVTERDPDGLVELCTMGTGVPDQSGRNDDCDVKWNAAGSGLVQPAQIAGLPSCDGFATGDRFPGYRCLTISTVPNGEDYPSITAVVAIRLT